jgi:hypothetical protein
LETAVLVAEQKADITTSVRVCALRKEAVGSAGWMAQHAAKRRIVSGLFYAISAFNQESVRREIEERWKAIALIKADRDDRPKGLLRAAKGR